MRKKLLTVLTVLFALVLGLSVLAACGDAAGDIELGETSFTFAVGETHNLTATAKEGGEITWTTSDESVVSIQMQVASRGIVMLKAEKAGTATITAKTQSGKTATCTATVENITVDISGTGVADGKLQMERYSTTQLTATVKRDGQPMSDGVRWTSSDESIVTVSAEGKLEALKPGNAVITATRVNSTVHGDLNVTVVWTEGPKGWYELHDWEQNKITPNLWGYWVDAGYEGANVKVTKAEYLGDPTGTGLVAGGVTVTYENQNDVQNEHGMQLFYRSSKAYNDANKDKEGFEPYNASKLLLDVNAHYLLKMDITVTASGTITVNGTQVDVVANQKQSIEIPFNHTDDGRIHADGDWANVSSAVYLMMGANNTMIQAATVTIENVSWELWDGSSAKLQTPTLSMSGKNVTITDPNTEGVKNYTVGLFEKDAEEGAEPVRMVTSTAKTFVLDDSKWPNGEYELRVRANGKDLRYSDSEWSAGVDHTVSHGAVQYDLTQGTSAQAKADLSDTYYYYTEGATVETATYNDGVITLKYSGNSSWTAMQLFYKNPSLTNGTKYTLTFKLNSPLAGKIRINGNMFDLVEGNNDIEVSYTEGSGADGLSMNIQFGEPTSNYSGTASVLTEGTFTLSNIVWATYTAPEGSIPTGEQKDAVADPNKWYLWADGNWTGSTVTIVDESADLDKKELVLDYTTTGAPRLGYSVQLFYENSANVVGTVYTLSLKVTLSVAGTITINGAQYTFTAGETKNLSIIYTEKGNEGKYNEGASIIILMGIPVPDGQDGSANAVMNARITISDWSWGDVNTEKLQTPTDLAIAQDGTVTFTDPNDAAKIGGYELGFFKGDTLKGQVTVTKGGKIDDSAIVNDTYDVKVRALGKDASYTVSDWSQGVEYTVSHEQRTSYNLKVGGSDIAKQDLTDTYYYCISDGVNVTAATYDNGTVTFTYSGNVNWYSVQLFYKNPSLTNGTKYTLTFKLNSPLAGKIRINGNMFDLVEGNNDIEVSYTEGSGADGLSMNIQFGEPTSDYIGTASVLTEGTFTLSNIEWNPYTAPEGSIPEGGQADAVNHPGIFYLWWDTNVNGATVTMNSSSIDYESKIISFSYTAVGDSRYGAGVQLFYEHPGAVDGKVYTITLTIKVSVTCDIRVCGQVEHFEANVARTLTITQAEPGYTAQYNEGATIAVLMGVESPLSNVKEADVTVTNWSVELSGETLSVPENFDIGADKKVTFTDTKNEDATYELGFFKKADDTVPYVTLPIANGDTIDNAKLFAGTYTVKVRAVKEGANASDWSQGKEYTVTKAASEATDLQWGEEFGAVSSDGRWIYWTDDQNPDSVEVEYVRFYEENGKYRIAVKESAKKEAGSLSYGFQMFHNDSANYQKGQQYTLTMKVNAKSAFKMTINGKEVQTVADQDVDVSVTFTLTYGTTNDYGDISLLDLQVPQAVGTTYEFELKDIAWAAVEGSDPTPAPTEGTEMTKLASKDGSDLVKGKWSYYAADNVTVKTATVSADGKTVTVTVSGLNEVGDFTIYYTPEGYENGQQHKIEADYLVTSTTDPGACTFTFKNCNAPTVGYAYGQSFLKQGFLFTTTNNVFYNIAIGFVNGIGVAEVPKGEVTLTISNIAFYES